jgi:hypothetical protein
MSHRRRLPSANHNCQSPLSIAKTQIAHYKTNAPILHATTKANATMITRP